MGLSNGKIGEAIGRSTSDNDGEVHDVGEGDVETPLLSLAMTDAWEEGKSRLDG